MVRTSGAKITDKIGIERPPLVVELVGLAGAGKTSLSRALSQAKEGILEGKRLRARRMADIPFYLRNAPLSLPTFFLQYRNDRSFTWEEFKAIIHLRGWHHVLRRRAENGIITILDQGPVFMLSWLNALGPANLRRQRFDAWWVGMFTRWSESLDMVVVLDAPDSVLIERIRGRGKWHIL